MLVLCHKILFTICMFVKIFSGIHLSFKAWKTNLFVLLSRVSEPKLVVISSLALKWQAFKFEALIFSYISLNKKRKKSMLQLWRPFILRLVKISLPSLAQESLITIQANDQKLVVMTNLLVWFLTNWKKPFCYMFIIWGI